MSEPLKMQQQGVTTMSRKAWLIVVAVCGGLVVLLVALLAVFTFLFPGAWGYRTLGGPVAVMKGAPPKHGFLGVDFAPGPGGPPTIQNVIEGSGAAEAGLQPGDVILAAGNVGTPDLPSLRRVVEATVPGDELTLKIRRGSDEKELRVRLISFTDVIVHREQGRSGEN